MVPPPDDETQRLLRLLALKRHEVPPPGFFDQLPARVLVSIRAGTEVPERSRWQIFISTILGEPVLAGSYAALGVGALLFGVSVFQMAVDGDSLPLATLADGPLPSASGIFAEPSLAGSSMGAYAVGYAAPAGSPQGLIFRVSPASLQRPEESVASTLKFMSSPQGQTTYLLDGTQRLVPVAYTAGR